MESRPRLHTYLWKTRRIELKAIMLRDAVAAPADIRRHYRLDGKVIGGSAGNVAPVHFQSQQCAGRAAPDAIERKHRSPHGEGALRGRLAQQPVQPAQRPTDGQPLVDVAEHDDRAI